MAVLLGRTTQRAHNMTLFTDLKEEVGILKAQRKEDHVRMETLIRDIQGLSRQIYLIVGGYTVVQILATGILIHLLTKGAS